MRSLLDNLMIVLVSVLLVAFVALLIFSGINRYELQKTSSAECKARGGEYIRARSGNYCVKPA